MGEVTLRKRRHIKRLSIRIDRKGEVRMAVPYLVSFRDAERFLEEKKGWIVKTREKILSSGPQMTVFGEGEIMVTRFHRIVVEQNGFDRSWFRVTGDLTTVYVERERDLEGEEIQAFIRKAIAETLRAEARIVLVPRVRMLAQTHGFVVNRVTVKNLKSRWGSCSSKNNINLNLYLMRLPDHLIDYVILHELVHTIHHNHSGAFWDELARHAPNPRALARELRKFHPEIP